MSYRKIIAGPLMAVAVYLFLGNITDAGEMASRMAGVAVLMAVWWLTEAVPMAVTALVPVIFFPLLGILDSKQTSMQYMDPIIFLFIGGFIIAYGIEKWMLHERIALKILMKVGSRPANILMGVMITTFLISMWISNTATVMMLYASVMAIISRIENNSNGNPQLHGITVSLLLGLAYAASIGGMTTLVGTPTNMIFYRAYNEQYPHEGGVNFLSWFLTAFPISLILLVFTFLLLRYLFIKSNVSIGLDKSFFRNSYTALGRTSYEEKTVGIIFFLTALLWFTRADIEVAGMKFRGWSSLFGAPDYISDGVVAVAMALLLFFIPSKQNRGESLLVWRDISKLPFDIILLFGGGFALAKGMETSGLSSWLASNLGFASGMNTVVFIILMCALVTLISEFASNVACIQLMLPILVSLQKEMEISPLLLMIPATLAASLGFMLPVATAPNTIVFGSRMLRANDMMRAGFWVDLAGIIVIALMSVLEL